jgi:UDPglucose 6-dehydrogenase
MNNAVVIGYGMVGKATAHAFGIKDYFSRHDATLTLEQASRLRYHFICLPTPNSPNGRYETEHIKDIIKQIVEYGGGQNVFILRSTVLPGTTKALCDSTGTKAIIHVPEFLSESTWQADAEHPDIIVIGGDRPNYREDVASIFRARYRGVDIFETDSVTSELIKCSRNALYSTKVIFANEIYEIAQTVGANYETIKQALYQSNWVGKNHLEVNYQRPDWNGSKRGLHGKCLPKDLTALAEFSGSKLLKTVLELNETYK